MDTPDFPRIQRYVLAQKEHLNHMWAGKKYGWLFLYLLATLIALVLLLSLVINAIALIISTSENIFPHQNLVQQPKELSYQVIEKNKKNEEGLYQSEFEIRIHSPAGNSSESVLISNNFRGEAECIHSYLGREAEFRAGLASTTEVLRAFCTTREPVIETGLLFVLSHES